MKLAIVVAQINLARTLCVGSPGYKFWRSFPPVFQWRCEMSECALFLLTLHPWTTMVLPKIPLLSVLIYWWVRNLHVGHSNVLEPHRKWGWGLNPRKVNFNPMVRHYRPFQVDALLWLLAVKCYHFIVQLKLQFLFSYVWIQSHHLFGK